MEALKSPNNRSLMTDTSSSAKQTVRDSSTDPLYNKYVIIGVLAFFVTILLLIILVHVIRILRRRCPIDFRPDLMYAHLAENNDTKSLDDSLEGDDDDDLVDLYTSCQLYVGDSEVNIASGSSSDLDCVSVAEGDHDSFINEVKRTEHSKSLDQSRSLLTRIFQNR